MVRPVAAQACCGTLAAAGLPALTRPRILAGCDKMIDFRGETGFNSLRQVLSTSNKRLGRERIASCRASHNGANALAPFLENQLDEAHVARPPGRRLPIRGRWESKNSKGAAC